MAKGPLFAAGDKVRLNIGGPIMVVKNLHSLSGSVLTCQWFVGKKLEEGTFASQSLVRVTDEEAGTESAPSKKKPEA